MSALSAAYLLSTTCRSIADGDSAQTTQTRIAPLFQHGNSRSTFGCVSVAPPTYLTERDALEVINEEAKRYGIEFEHDIWSLQVELTRPGPPAQATDKEDSIPEDNTVLLKLNLDGTDMKHSISYEYVSAQDISQWKMEPVCALTGYKDTMETANALRSGISKLSPSGTYGVFYAPCEYKNVAGRKQTVKEVCIEELRKQVRDFIKWLKAEGVI